MEEGVEDQELGAGVHGGTVPVDVGHGLAREHRGGRPQAHRLVQAGLEVGAAVRRPIELGLDLAVLPGVAREQGQAAEGVNRECVVAREEPVRHLAVGLRDLVRGRLAEQADQAPLLPRLDVPMDPLHQLGQALRRLAGQPVRLVHELAEQLREGFVVGRAVTEDHATGDAAHRALPAVPVELTAAVGVRGTQHPVRLLANHGREPIGEPVLVPGVQHRLVEAPAVLPGPVAGDRQRVGLERRHPLPLARWI